MEIIRKEILLFFQVAKMSSLTRAADYLDIGQPYLSKVIKKLESEAGAKLFFRSKKGVSLTPAGQSLFDSIHDHTQGIVESRFSSLKDKGSIQGRYHCGIPPVLAHFILPRFYLNILQENENLNLDIHFCNSSEVNKRVAEGSLSFGVAVNASEHPDFIIKKIISEKSYIFESQKNKTHDVIFYNPEMIKILAHLSQVKKASKVKRFIPIENYDIIAEIIASSGGLGILPENIAKTYSLKKYYNRHLMKVDIDLIYRYELKDDSLIRKVLEHIL